MWAYLKAAFFAGPEVPGLGRLPVNVLGVAAFGALGFLNPGFWLLGLAGEAVYLFGLAGHPRFRKYVDARKAKAARERRSRKESPPDDTVERIVRELSEPAIRRFEALRRHCQELQQIAAQLRDPEQANFGAPLEDLQLAGLDRLLWTFLRLLFTQYMLERFFQRTNEDQINKTIRNLEQSLRAQSAGPDDPQRQKIRKALEDNIQTSRERLANLEKARSNSELVRLEIDRLENKIQSLSEMAINRQEPGYIVHQVDEVASSMVQTERTMNELQFATGLAAEEEVPQLLRRQAIATKK
jgi:chemotaxis protein histidine kinase CheA